MSESRGHVVLRIKWCSHALHRVDRCVCCDLGVHLAAGARLRDRRWQSLREMAAHRRSINLPAMALKGCWVMKRKRRTAGGDICGSGGA